MDLPATGHDPVLLHEVLEILQPAPGQVFVDCTLGRGGHSLAIGQKLGSSGQLICLDVDPRNLEFARDRLANVDCQKRFFHANFAELGDVLAEVGIAQVDGILADLGISTNQLFDQAYGLSFAAAMPLDMRLDPRIERTAADLVNHLGERELADLLFNLAQERASFKIARKIIERRKAVPITTTDQLAELIRLAIGRSYEKIDPATRTFMALRMAVNDELGNLEALLQSGPGFLKVGGKMAVIGFHSTEDRLTKRAFKMLEERGLAKILIKKPIEASESEINVNPRSRSAKMRAIEKI
ncbi:MAG TPA: 16S rRNA (cytosine(1402)-N(4))-methyltransferase RsmH [Tepidisphaeraceae bacterium]|jgi:16S rRNA (cytosine1402-N4)-methyltransferase